jgi:hypothetical protein
MKRQIEMRTVPLKRASCAEIGDVFTAKDVANSLSLAMNGRHAAASDSDPNPACSTRSQA